MTQSYLIIYLKENFSSTELTRLEYEEKDRILFVWIKYSKASAKCP